MRVKRKFGAFFGILAILFCFSSCYVPEKFTASIFIKKNGEVTLKYSGTALVYEYVVQALNDAQLKEVAKSYSEQTLQEGEKESYKYLGNGRFQIDIEKKGIIEKGDEFFVVDRDSKFISVKYNSFVAYGNKIYLDELKITLNSVDSKNYEALKEFGLKVNGKLSITSEVPLQNLKREELSKKGKYWVYTQNYTSLPEETIVLFANMDNEE